MIESLGGVFSATASRFFSGAQAGATAVSATEPAKTRTANAPALEISLSREGQKAAGLMANLPPMTLDPALHMRQAETHLKRIMGELGIPASTDVKIHSNGDGSFRVAADHPKAVALETMINNGAARELRNALIGAHNGAVLQRTSKAMSIAMKGAEQNPGKNEQYYAWVKGIVDEAMTMGYAFSYSGDKMTGTLLKPGNIPVKATDGLDLPS